MVGRTARRITPLSIVVYGFLIFVLVVTLYPFLNVLAISVSDARLVNAGKVTVFPKGLTEATYAKVLQNGAFWLGYRNTVIYTVLGTVIAMMFTTLAAFPLSKKWLPGAGVILAFFVFTMFFNGGLIPNFLLIKQVGLLDTIWAIVIPMAINPWNMIIMRTFFVAIPQSLEEAAEIDGLNPFQILIRIVLPLSKPIIATLGLFYAVFFWNDWFRPFILLTGSELQPVTLFLRNIVMGAEIAALQGEISEAAAQSASVTMKAASIILVVFPVLCVYPFLQKHFVKGVLIGSVKG